MEYVNERKPTPADEGSEWLYWDTPRKTWRHVLLVTVPERPQRVRVQHLDADMHGKAEWVTVGRCTVPWELREDYWATEEAWERLISHAPSLVEIDAADRVTLLVVPEQIAMMHLRKNGVLEIYDLAALASLAGISATELTSHEDTIIDGTVYVPWPTVMEVIRRLCTAFPFPILAALEQEDADHATEAQRWLEHGEPDWMQAAREGERWARQVVRSREHYAAVLRVIRGWLNEPEPTLTERYAALRQQYVELVLAILPALEQLDRIRSNKSAQIADQLREVIKRAPR